MFENILLPKIQKVNFNSNRFSKNVNRHTKTQKHRSKKAQKFFCQYSCGI